MPAPTAPPDQASVPGGAPIPQPANPLRERIRSSALYWRIKLFLKRITGREIWLRRDLAINESGTDDYHFDSTRLSDKSVVYSFGIGDSIGFETELIAAHGMTVHAFDPTPHTLQWLQSQHTPPQLEFHPWAVAGEDGELTMFPRRRADGQRSTVMWTMDPGQADITRAITVPAHTIPSLMKKLGHERLDLVKLDVEGAEYDALSGMLDQNVLPTQILLEFHHRFPGIGKRKTLDCIARLRSVGYQLFWISRTGREAGFLRDA